MNKTKTIIIGAYIWVRTSYIFRPRFDGVAAMCKLLDYVPPSEPIIKYEVLGVTKHKFLGIFKWTTYHKIGYSAEPDTTFETLEGVRKYCQDLHKKYGILTHSYIGTEILEPKSFGFVLDNGKPLYVNFKQYYGTSKI